MRGMEKELSPFLAMIWCVFSVVMFLLLTIFPPILAASAYTAVAIVVFRICYSTISKTNPDFSDFVSTTISFLCAALWPAYFSFGVFLFLGRVIRGE